MKSLVITFIFTLYGASANATTCESLSSEIVDVYSSNNTGPVSLKNTTVDGHVNTGVIINCIDQQLQTVALEDGQKAILLDTKKILSILSDDSNRDSAEGAEELVLEKIESHLLGGNVESAYSIIRDHYYTKLGTDPRFEKLFESADNLLFLKAQRQMKKRPLERYVELSVSSGSNLMTVKNNLSEIEVIEGNVRILKKRIIEEELSCSIIKDAARNYERLNELIANDPYTQELERYFAQNLSAKSCFNGLDIPVSYVETPTGDSIAFISSMKFDLLEAFNHNTRRNWGVKELTINKLVEMATWLSGMIEKPVALASQAAFIGVASENPELKKANTFLLGTSVPVDPELQDLRGYSFLWSANLNRITRTSPDKPELGAQYMFVVEMVEQPS